MTLKTAKAAGTTGTTGTTGSTRARHLHTWPDPMVVPVGPYACTGCGMTPGRASRAGGDRNTIKRFLRSEAVGVALQKVAVDPVLYSMVMSTLMATADEGFESKVLTSTTTSLAAAVIKLATVGGKKAALSIGKVAAPLSESDEA